MNKKGYTLIELVMVMALLALFGLLCFTLVQTGAQAYARIAGDKDSENNARIALDYLESRIRQSDQKDAIMIVDNPFGEGQALVIRDTSGDTVEDLWILESDGMLLEYYTASGTEPDPALDFEIVAVAGFDMSSEGRMLTIRVTYSCGDEARSLQRRVALRSSQKEVMG